MRRMGGFTLIELIIVLMLAALVLGLALPAFSDLVLAQRVKSASFTLGSAAVFARSEAIKRNQDVAINAAAGGWQNGWTIAVGATQISQQEPFPGGVQFQSGGAQLIYQPSGRLSAGESPSFQISGDADKHARCVSFDLAGLPKSMKGVCP